MWWAIIILKLIKENNWLASGPLCLHFNFLGRHQKSFANNLTSIFTGCSDKLFFQVACHLDCTKLKMNCTNVCVSGTFKKLFSGLGSWNDLNCDNYVICTCRKYCCLGMDPRVDNSGCRHSEQNHVFSQEWRNIWIPFTIIVYPLRGNVSL